MQKVNHPLKARMFVGGLKSLLIDVVNDIEEIEKTGGVSNKFVEGLVDVKAAIDLTLLEFKKVTVRCCEHGEAHDTCDASCSDDDYCSECESPSCVCGRVDDDVDHCPDCEEYEDECVCDLEEEEELPPPPPARKVTVTKKAAAAVVMPKKKGK